MEDKEFIYNNIPWMWRTIFGELEKNKKKNYDPAIISFIEERARHNNMSLKEYIIYKQAKECLLEEKNV